MTLALGVAMQLKKGSDLKNKSQKLGTTRSEAAAARPLGATATGTGSLQIVGRGTSFLFARVGKACQENQRPIPPLDEPPPSLGQW